MELLSANMVRKVPFYSRFVMTASELVALANLRKLHCFDVRSALF